MTEHEPIRRAVLAGLGEARNDASVWLTNAVALMVDAATAALAGVQEGLRSRIDMVCATVGSDDSRSRRCGRHGTGSTRVSNDGRNDRRSTAAVGHQRDPCGAVR
ncbi:MAG: hypothetical protein M5U19_17160 [Microthrixaceae bacterium]|nr:hypothetical protein [Microthrixaceae bacterium]